MFYKETEFTNTYIGNIPKEWKVDKIGQIVPTAKGSIKIGPFGSQLKKDELSRTGIKVYGQENIIGKDFSKGIRYVSNDKFQTLRSVEILPDDVLITMAGTVGYSAVFPKEAEKGIMDSHLVRIQVEKSKCLPVFLSMLINDHPAVRTQFKSMSQGAIMSGLNSQIIRNVRIPLPCIEEQSGMIEIVSSLDGLVQRTERMIVKTERLKKGFMQELLNKGIGHKEFKDTEIGRIPTNWDVDEIGEIITLEYGKGLSQENRVQGRYPVVGSNGIVGYHNRPLVKGPGIVVGRKGTMGAVSWLDLDFWPIDTTYYVRTKRKEVDLRWLFFELKFLKLQRLRLSDVVPGLKRDLVYSQKIAIPPFEEQQRIATILITLDNQLDLERAEEGKIVTVKQGLMNLLFTGRVRVRVD